MSTQLNLTHFRDGLSGISRNTAATGAGLSPRIWMDCPILGMMEDPGVGTLVRDDFTYISTTGYPYEISGTNGTFAAVAGSQYGEGLLSAPGTDNDEIHIAYNNDVAGCINCSADKKWWFEARLKLSQVTAECGVFVGLLDEAASQDDLMANNNGIITATVDCLGFQIVEAAAAALTWRTIMQLAARAAVSETAAAASVSYVKLGMKSTPNSAGTVATIKFYVNGAPLADTTTTAATDYPLNATLIPHFGLKILSSAIMTMTIDWWQTAQLR